jgi:hypothetical protein
MEIMFGKADLLIFAYRDGTNRGKGRGVEKKGQPQAAVPTCPLPPAT